MNPAYKTNCRYYRIRFKWQDNSSSCVFLAIVEEGMFGKTSFAPLRNWKVFADIVHATKEAITIALRSGSRGNETFILIHIHIYSDSHCFHICINVYAPLRNKVKLRMSNHTCVTHLHKNAKSLEEISAILSKVYVELKLL